MTAEGCRGEDGREGGARCPVEGLTVHVDLLGQLDKLHLGGHVAHGAHAVAQVSAVDVAVLVLVKFSEGVSELWGREERWTWLGWELQSLWSHRQT